jgi:hypothetical protein
MPFLPALLMLLLFPPLFSLLVRLRERLTRFPLRSGRFVLHADSRALTLPYCLLSLLPIFWCNVDGVVSR